MKTTKIRLIAWMITLAAVATGINAEGQQREYRSDRHQQRNDKQYHVENKKIKREYKKPTHDFRGWENDNKVRKQQKKNNDSSYKYRDNHRDDYRGHYDRNYKTSYRHPKYGMVYRKFDKAPLRLKHHHGDYYYYGGNYYRHHDHIGYVRVEFPKHLVFKYLPFHCDQFRVGNHIYYRHGDMVFERCDYGYRIAPSFGIQFSAHF